MAPNSMQAIKKPSPYIEQKQPPPSYVCHRCNQPGHYINNCPTNGDPNYDFHKVKKPTGIPRVFLKPVTGGKSGATLMMPGGGFAVMTPNEYVIVSFFSSFLFNNSPLELNLIKLCPQQHPFWMLKTLLQSSSALSAKDCYEMRS